MWYNYTKGVLSVLYDASMIVKSHNQSYKSSYVLKQANMLQTKSHNSNV